MLVRELEKEIITLRVQNRYAALQLQNIQDEIEHFTAQYYSAVEDLCLQLAETDAKLRQYDAKILAAQKAERPAPQDSGYDIQPRPPRPKLQLPQEDERITLEREVKNLYRGLIKLVHPDVSEEKLKAAEYTMMVNRAYNERNYRQLVELDQVIRSGNASEHELRQQRNKLIDTTFELKMQREDLFANPIYELCKKFEQAEDGGVAMIRAVRGNLEAKIAARKRDLMDKKLRYLECIGGLITETA